MAALLLLHPGTGAVLKGHSDTLGSAELNRLLSLGRAAAVRDELRRLGVPAVEPLAVEAVAVSDEVLASTAPAAVQAPTAAVPRPAPSAALPTIEQRLWQLELEDGVAPLPTPALAPSTSPQASTTAPQTMPVAPQAEGQPQAARAPEAPASARPAEISIPITVPATVAPSGEASPPPAVAAAAVIPAATAAVEPAFPLAVGDTMVLTGWAWTEDEPVALEAHRDVQFVLLVHGGGSDREAELTRTAAAAQYLRAYLVSTGADSASGAGFPAPGDSGRLAE